MQVGLPDHADSDEPCNRSGIVAIAPTYRMDGFSTWSLLESKGFDLKSYNLLFDYELDKLLPRVERLQHRVGLIRMRKYDWTAQIITALRQADVIDPVEMEEAVHAVVVYLLLFPGRLFGRYNPATSGPLPAWFDREVRRGVAVYQRNRPHEPLD